MLNHWKYVALICLGLSLTACVGKGVGKVEGWTYTTITIVLPDKTKTVVETRHKTKTDKGLPHYDSSGKVIFVEDDEDYEDRDVKMPDGTWIGCGDDANCASVYSRNKDRHPAKSDDKGGGDGGGGGEG